MNPGLLKFKITPRVVKANTKQVITVEGVDDSSKLYDDCEYIVSIFQLDEYSYK